MASALLCNENRVLLRHHSSPSARSLSVGRGVTSLGTRRVVRTCSSVSSQASAACSSEKRLPTSSKARPPCGPHHPSIVCAHQNPTEGCRLEPVRRSFDLMLPFHTRVVSSLSCSLPLQQRARFSHGAVPPTPHRRAWSLREQSQFHKISLELPSAT